MLTFSVADGNYSSIKHLLLPLVLAEFRIECEVHRTQDGADHFKSGSSSTPLP